MAKGESQVEIKMERGLRKRFRVFGVNLVQLGGLLERSVRSKQQWDPEISAYLTDKLEQISMLNAESGEFTFRIYLWKSLRDIKV